MISFRGKQCFWVVRVKASVPDDMYNQIVFDRLYIFLGVPSMSLEEGV